MEFFLFVNWLADGRIIKYILYAAACLLCDGGQLFLLFATQLNKELKNANAHIFYSSGIPIIQDLDISWNYPTLAKATTGLLLSC